MARKATSKSRKAVSQAKSSTSASTGPASGTAVAPAAAAPTKSNVTAVPAKAADSVTSAAPKAADPIEKRTEEKGKPEVGKDRDLLAEEYGATGNDSKLRAEDALARSVLEHERQVEMARMAEEEAAKALQAEFERQSKMKQEAMDEDVEVVRQDGGSEAQAAGDSSAIMALLLNMNKGVESLVSRVQKLEQEKLAETGKVSAAKLADTAEMEAGKQAAKEEAEKLLEQRKRELKAAERALQDLKAPGASAAERALQDLKAPGASEQKPPDVNDLIQLVKKGDKKALIQIQQLSDAGEFGPLPMLAPETYNSRESWGPFKTYAIYTGASDTAVVNNANSPFGAKLWSYWLLADSWAIHLNKIIKITKGLDTARDARLLKKALKAKAGERFLITGKWLRKPGNADDFKNREPFPPNCWATADGPFSEELDSLIASSGKRQLKDDKEAPEFKKRRRGTGSCGSPIRLM